MTVENESGGEGSQKSFAAGRYQVRHLLGEGAQKTRRHVHLNWTGPLVAYWNGGTEPLTGLSLRWLPPTARTY